jgi:hypothetical protein
MPELSRMTGSAGLVALCSCAAALMSCGRDHPSEEPETANVIAEVTRSAPAVEPPLDRERLLLAVIRAASAFAAGGRDSEAQRKFDGKRFELRVRFGCGDGGDESRGWRFDEKSRTLRLRVSQDISKDDIIAAKVAGDEFESVEGMWLRRPWLLAAACPAAQARPSAEEPDVGPAVPAEPMAASPRVGVATFSTSADSRTTRRQQRPYEATKILGEGEAPSGQGYDFVMAGRLRALPDGRVIACSSESPDSPPACIISVHIDRVSIERPDTRAQIAEWTG